MDQENIHQDLKSLELQSLRSRYQTNLDQLAEQYGVERVELQLFASLGSTNQKLWGLIKETAPKNNAAPIAIAALTQSSGKGQWGKTWLSPSGGMYLSLALDCNLALDQSFHLVMASATGITRLLREYNLPVTIKWSNDLILEQRKLGGIKIETKTVKGLITKTVVGIGINWSNPVPPVGINLQSYYQNQPNLLPQVSSLEQLTAIATIGIIQGYQSYLNLGMSHTLKQYQELLNSIGKLVTVNNCPGKVIGVNNQGQLKVSLTSPGASTKIMLNPGEFSLGY